jgi:hypothetical protein
MEISPIVPVVVRTQIPSAPFFAKSTFLKLRGPISAVFVMMRTPLSSACSMTTSWKSTFETPKSVPGRLCSMKTLCPALLRMRPPTIDNSRNLPAFCTQTPWPLLRSMSTLLRAIRSATPPLTISTPAPPIIVVVLSSSPSNETSSTKPPLAKSTLKF